MKGAQPLSYVISSLSTLWSLTRCLDIEVLPPLEGSCHMPSSLPRRERVRVRGSLLSFHPHLASPIKGEEVSWLSCRGFDTPTICWPKYPMTGKGVRVRGR